MNASSVTMGGGGGNGCSSGEWLDGFVPLSTFAMNAESTARLLKA